MQSDETIYVLQAVAGAFGAILLLVLTLGFTWFVLWKLVLVKVPLFQELFGLKKTLPPPPVSQPPQRVFSSASSVHTQLRHRPM
mmetsp:Transcript_32660/g.55079  ORF Transcript_32660/g.55079 Transcript_32660/m.55079 type:complete len:84 (-) Transcript_32660:382-633(-)